MKKVSTDTTDLGIYEDDGNDYTLSLRRIRPTNEISLVGEKCTTEEMGLYAVVTCQDGIPITRYVIAESEDGAYGQALCHVDYEEREQVDLVSVTRLPLMIRGWGSRRF